MFFIIIIFNGKSVILLKINFLNVRKQRTELKLHKHTRTEK